MTAITMKESGTVERVDNKSRPFCRGAAWMNSDLVISGGFEIGANNVNQCQPTSASTVL